MLRERVASHYRQRGYRLHEDVRLRGESGTIHLIDLLAEGRNGHLVVGLPEDDVDATDLAAVRRAARDLGCTPVVAAEGLSETLRVLAARSGVVILDDAALDEPGEDEADHPWPESAGKAGEKESVPWPASGRARPTVDPAMRRREVDELLESWKARDNESEKTDTDAARALWRESTEPTPAAAPPAPEASFDWLRSAAPEPPARPKQQLETPLKTTVAAPPIVRVVDWTRVAMAAAFGAGTGVVFFALYAAF